MDILGIGFPELIFILIIALMVFGPRRLPEIAGKAGKYLADLRNMSNGLMAEWQREIKASELQEEFNKTRQEFTQARDTVAGAGRQIAEETTDVAKAIAPPKIDAGKVLSDQASSLEAAASVTPKPTEDEAAPQKNTDMALEKPISPSKTASDNNGAGEPSPVASTDSDKIVNEQ